MKKTKIDKKLILQGKVVKIKIDLFLKMAFKFDNIYEKNVYDEWNRTIKRMGSYRIRKQYYPHKMETYETKKRTLDFIKNGLLKSYKIHKFYSKPQPINTTTLRNVTKIN